MKQAQEELKKLKERLETASPEEKEEIRKQLEAIEAKKAAELAKKKEAGERREAERIAKEKEEASKTTYTASDITSIKVEGPPKYYVGEYLPQLRLAARLWTFSNMLLSPSPSF